MFDQEKAKALLHECMGDNPKLSGGLVAFRDADGMAYMVSGGNPGLVMQCLAYSVREFAQAYHISDKKAFRHLSDILKQMDMAREKEEAKARQAKLAGKGDNDGKTESDSGGNNPED